MRPQALFLPLQVLVLLLQLSVEPLPLGNVLMGDDAAAIRHLPTHDANYASIRQLLDARGGIAEAASPAADEAFAILDVVKTIRQAIIEDLAQGCAGLHLVCRQTVHLPIPPVAHDEPLVGIEHGKPLQHVVERGIQFLVLPA